jgi:hypothetical protein
MGGGRVPNLKHLEDRVHAITYCKDTYTITTESAAIVITDGALAQVLSLSLPQTFFS